MVCDRRQGNREKGQMIKEGRVKSAVGIWREVIMLRLSDTPTMPPSKAQVAEFAARHVVVENRE